MSIKQFHKKPRCWIWTLITLLGILSLVHGTHVAKRVGALRELKGKGLLVDGPRSRTKKLLRKCGLPNSLCDVVGDIMVANGTVDALSITSVDSEPPVDLIGLRVFPELTFLELNGNRFDNRSLEVLRFMPNLKEFYYSGLDHTVDDNGLQHLRHCNRLTTIELDGADTSGCFLELLPHPELVRELKIASSDYFDDEGLLRLARCPNLEYVHLFDTIWYKGAGLVVFEKLKNVKTLAVYLPHEKYRCHVAHVPNLSINSR